MRPVPASIAAKMVRAAGPFAQRGLDQTKIEDIAEATGMPKSTLYYYFGGKEEIFVFLQQALFGEVADAVTIAVETEGSAAQRLCEVIRAQVSVMVARPLSWRAFLADLGLAAQAPQLVEALTHAYYAPIERLLREGVSDGSLRRTEDPQTTSTVIFGAVSMIGLHDMQAGRPLDAGRLAGQVIGFVIDGLAT